MSKKFYIKLGILAAVAVVFCTYFLWPLPALADVNDQYKISIDEGHYRLLSDRYDNLIAHSYYVLGGSDIDDQGVGAMIKLSKDNQSNWTFDSTQYTLTNEHEFDYRGSAVKVQIYRQEFDSDLDLFRPVFIVSCQTPELYASINCSYSDMKYDRQYTMDDSLHPQDQEMIEKLIDSLFYSGQSVQEA